MTNEVNPKKKSKKKMIEKYDNSNTEEDIDPDFEEMMDNMKYF